MFREISEQFVSQLIEPRVTGLRGCRPELSYLNNNTRSATHHAGERTMILQPQPQPLTSRREFGCHVVDLDGGKRADSSCIRLEENKGGHPVVDPVGEKKGGHPMDGG